MIFCDSMMVVKGIIRRHLPPANSVRCMIEEDAVAEMARTNGITRSMAAVDCWKPDLAGSAVVIGNAPTALFRLLELLEEEANPPALILGFPVGFVGASESKDALIKADHSLEFITLKGRRGGSAMAAAAEGAVTEPFRSEFGWHILEVLGRRDKDFSGEIQRNQVANYIREQKYQEELDAWLRKIREEAFVDIK